MRLTKTTTIIDAARLARENGGHLASKNGQLILILPDHCRSV